MLPKLEKRLETAHSKASHGGYLTQHTIEGEFNKYDDIFHATSVSKLQAV